MMDYPRAYAGQDALTVGTQRTTDLMVEALTGTTDGAHRRHRLR